MPLLQNRAKRQLQDLLLFHADALIAGPLDLDQLLAQYDAVALTQVEGLLALAEQINRSMPRVAASDQFVERLRRQLAEEAIMERRSWWERIRQLPPRTQLAAGIGGATLTAGVVLLASRPVWDAWLVRRNRRTFIP